jgi:ubiquinone/menaquinone biosynthesis C-methylase UbiE
MVDNTTDRALIPLSATVDAEDDRVRAVYARRRLSVPIERYARTDPFALCSYHEREERMATLLREEGLNSLAGMRILDVGCGRGETLRQLLEYGANPELLIGIDLLDANVNDARRLAPHVKVICGSAARLPFPDESFDLVIQFMLFTSVLKDEAKRMIAAEMARVLMPGGRILWYDFSFNNPRNPDVRGIGKRELRALFPGLTMKVRRVTLAPPLGRIVAPFSIVLYYLLSRVRPLCTHQLGLLQKPNTKTLA